MILPIDDKWRIKSDAYCWHVQKYIGVRKSGKFKGWEEWKSVRYYKSLAQASYGLVELALMEGDTTTLAEALDAV